MEKRSNLRMKQIPREIHENFCQVEECSVSQNSPPKIDRIWAVGRPGALDNTDNALRQGLDKPPRTTRQKQEKPSSAGVDHCCFQYNVLNYVLEFPSNASKSTQTQKSQMANMFYSMSMPSVTLETTRKMLRNLFMIISRVMLAMEIQ